MGVFRLTGETHNKKPVWAKHDGTQKLFYNNGKLYCDDDDDCVITDITEGQWMIWPDPTENIGGVKTADPAGGLWPHQVRSWEYYTTSGGWQSDPLLTVTGNININININIL